jgi:putative SOS response-associated peptidase YedK
MNATKYEPMKGLSNGTRLETFALVTTEPNELVSQIHERLALIPDEDESRQSRRGQYQQQRSRHAR